MKQTISFVLIFALHLYLANCKDITAAYKINNFWVAVDSAGNTLYESRKILDVEKYSEGLLGAYIFDNSKPASVYFDAAGKIAVKSPSAIPYEFRNGRALVIELLDPRGKESKFGFINKKGKVVIPIEYLDVVPFYDNLAYVMNFDRRGIIDTNGNFVIPMDSGFVAYHGYANDLIVVSSIEAYKMGLMNKSGEMVTDYIFDELGRFSEGLCKAYKDYFGYINSKGIYVIEPKFDEAKEFRESRAFVAEYNRDTDKYKWAIIDTDGVFISTFMFDEPKYFSEGLAAVKQENIWKYVDNSGKIVIDDNFTFAGTFKNGLAFVISLDGRKYFINKNGERVFELPQNADIVLDCRTNERFEKK